MSISVGIPTMMLDRATHKPGDNKHGNMKAVLKEGLPDENGVRKCHDEDYRPEDTKNNFCFGAVQNVTADAICNYWEMLADDYRVKVNTKNGVKERKLREDADIGMALIVKPEMSAMQAMTPDRQIEFLEDSYEAMNKVFYKHGLLIDVGVVHLDEGVPHMHIYGHDPDFKLSKKMNLKFYNDLNHGLYVKEMRAKGWDIAPKKSNFVEDTKNMSEAELKEYKELKKKERKERHGKSSKQYKMEQELKKLDEAIKSKQAELAGLNEPIRTVSAPHKEVSKKEAPKQEAPKQESPKQEAPKQVGVPTVKRRSYHEQMKEQHIKDDKRWEEEEIVSMDDVIKALTP